MSGERVLVVDDDLSIRQLLGILLDREGFVVETATSGEQALSRVERGLPDLVITDLTMPGMSGLELLRELKVRSARQERDVEVVLLTAYGTTRTAVEAMKEGAADYVAKPFDNAELLMVVRNALARRQLEAENQRLRRELRTANDPSNLVASSEAMRKVVDLIRRVKDARINCLITGESGTGKEMVARAIHYGGARAAYPFVPVNCGAIASGLVESELFGYKKGAFTGALRDKVGLIQSAHRGTLFLDEVNSLPAAAQVSLLRVIQERRFLPVGDVREVEVDVRLIAASNVDLEHEVEKGRFREDLYYRLNVVQIPLLPLRQRPEDIPDLVRDFLNRFSREYGKEVRISPDALRVLQAADYPGNVRELQNVVERAVALCAGAVIQPDDLPPRLRREAPAPINGAPSFPPEGVDLDALLNQAEQGWLRAALEAAEGNKTRAAQLLNLSFRSFRYRMAKHGLGGED